MQPHIGERYSIMRIRFLEGLVTCLAHATNMAVACFHFIHAVYRGEAKKNFRRGTGMILPTKRVYPTLQGCGHKINNFICCFLRYYFKIHTLRLELLQKL